MSIYVLNTYVFYAVNQTQLVEFLNTKYLPFDVDNSDLYELKSLSFNEIFSDVLKITNVLDDKTCRIYLIKYLLFV